MGKVKELIDDLMAEKEVSEEKEEVSIISYDEISRDTETTFKKLVKEAFSVDNGCAAFVVFLLGDPHLLEGGEGSQDGSSDPYGVFSLRWSNDFDLDGGWGQGSDFLL